MIGYLNFVNFFENYGYMPKLNTWFFFKLQLWTLKTTLTTLGVNTSLDKSCKSSLLPKVIVQFSPHCIDFSCDEIMWCACLSLVSMNMFALFNTCGSNCTYALMMYIIYVH
jgi:hypothetical protein